MLFADYILANADTLYEDAAVAIKDGRIAAIGQRRELFDSWRAAESLDLGMSLLMPGLINAHTHAAMTFLRGLADDLPLLSWLQDVVFPIERRLSPQIIELGTLLGHAEMLATGTVACIDMYLFEEAVFRAASQSGIRCMGGEAIFNFPSAACCGWQEALERTRRLAEQFSNSERFFTAVNPHSVYTTNAEILAACRSVALELDLPLHIHLAESEAETENCMKMHGCRPFEWCEKNGLCDCRLILAHAVDLSDREIERAAACGAIVVHNPSSNMKLASGVAPVEKMLQNGLAVALGTDGPASNNALNMFAEMGRAALLQKVFTQNPSALPAKAVFDMATIAGAKAFGQILSGSLEPGAAADCIALDLRPPNMQPMFQPVSQAVYAASGHECKFTMINGEILYKDGVFTRFDYDALLGEIDKLRHFALRAGGKG